MVCMRNNHEIIRRHSRSVRAGELGFAMEFPSSPRAQDLLSSATIGLGLQCRVLDLPFLVQVSPKTGSNTLELNNTISSSLHVGRKDTLPWAHFPDMKMWCKRTSGKRAETACANSSTFRSAGVPSKSV